MLMCICATSLTLSSCSKDDGNGSINDLEPVFAPIVGTWTQSTTSFYFGSNGKGNKSETEIHGTSSVNVNLGFTYTYSEKTNILVIDYTDTNDAVKYLAEITGNTMMLFDTNQTTLYYTLTKQ